MCAYKGDITYGIGYELVTKNYIYAISHIDFVFIDLFNN